jgi:hypothetical protein
MSLRAAVNDHCKSCIYDNLAPGTWRQQVTLCDAISCPLYGVRRKTAYPIPESTLSYYGDKSASYQPQDGNSVEAKHG